MLVNKLVKFFHHLLDPHCSICSDERHEERQCTNCETLRALLDAEKFEKKELLNYLLNGNKPTVETVVNQLMPEPVVPKNIPWRVRREMLEAEDKAAAKIMRDRQNELREQAKSTEELEKELLG